MAGADPAGMAGLASQRGIFDIPRDVAYLNAAAYGPIPRPVRQAGEAGVAAKSTPWTMDRAAAEACAEAARAEAAALIGASADDIAVTAATSYGVATAGLNLPLARGARVLLMAGEFPSQSLEWARLAEAQGGALDIVPRPPDGDWTAALLERIEAPGLPPVGIAALTPLHWTDGAVIDLDRIAPALRRQGAALVVDATQAAGVMDIDVGRLAPDFLAFPTYKWLLGPYSLAFLYAAPSRQDGRPLEQHAVSRVGGSEPFAGRSAPFLPGARRYDRGERNDPVALPMAVAGMRLLHGWGRAAIEARLRALTDELAEIAAAHGLVPLARHLRPPHILGLRPPEGGGADALAATLAARGVHVAVRGGVLRVSPHVHVDAEDLARFRDALAGATEGRSAA